MKIKPNRSPRALIALLPTLMLVSPVFAQEVPTQTTPPPAPVVQSAPVPAPAAPVFAPSAPVVQAVPDYSRAAPPPVVATVADAPDEPGTTARRAPALRAVTPRAEPVAPPASAAVVAAPAATAPVTTAPVAAEPVVTIAPATQVSTDAVTTQKNTQASASVWPWIVGAGIVLLGLIALLATRRRRDETVDFDESAYDAPTRAVPEPVMAAPVIGQTPPQVLQPISVADAAVAPAPVSAEDTHIVEADDADVAALTQAHAPVPDRPWLEFAMRPVRAGTTSDEALVEIELTVGNAGSVMAEDVRISTFLFASEPADAVDFEQLLLDHGSDAGTDRVSIAAGEGTRVDATLALPKRDLAVLFNPVVVADARYRLPDGSEGRTYASFSIGMAQEDGGLGAMENSRPSMHEDIEARLYGTPEHA